MIDLTLKKPPINVVAITGFSRSGKSMLAPIVSSLKKAETLKMDYTLEQYTILNYLGLSQDDVTVYLIRYMVNFILYNSMIGRNSNFRPSDWTSIWNSSDPKIYFKRLLSQEGDDVYDKIEENDKMIQFITSIGLFRNIENNFGITLNNLIDRQSDNEKRKILVKQLNIGYNLFYSYKTDFIKTFWCLKYNIPIDLIDIFFSYTDIYRFQYDKIVNKSLSI